MIAAPLFVSRLCFIKVPKYAFLLSLALRLFYLSFFINVLGSSMFRFILRFVFNHIAFKFEPVGKIDWLDCITFVSFGQRFALSFADFYTFLQVCFVVSVHGLVCLLSFGLSVRVKLFALFLVLRFWFFLKTHVTVFCAGFCSHFSCSEIPNNWLSSSIVCFTSFVENLLISLKVKFVSVSVPHLKYHL